MNRVLIAAAGIAVAVVLFVVFRPDGGDDEATSQPPPPPPPTGVSTTSTTPPPTTTKLKPTPTVARVLVVLRGGRPVGGIRRATVAKNRRVILTVRSDVADHVHLHGYDIMRDVAPGSPGRIDFRATIPGRFEVELEERELQIAELTVNP